MAEHIEVLLFLLGIISLLAVLATRLQFSFPILLVLAGLAIGITPGLPHVEVESEVVFLLFLPPLLFSAAVAYPWKQLLSNIRSITLLAVGLVLATMVAVAYTAWWVIPGFSLAAGFVLGAIVSPPDAVAANTVLSKLNVPRRIQNVLEGESLVNDASGLVAWQFAVAALVTGAFSLRAATGEFFLMSIGGIAIGVVGAFVISEILHRVQEVAVELTLFLMTPFMLYLLAEQVNVSGVLAVVAGGMLIGHRSDHIFSPKARLEATAVWGLVQHLLVSLVFILIGLQFPALMRGLHPLSDVHLITALVSVVVVVVAVRFLWIFSISWILKRVFIPKQLQEPPIENRHLIIMSWCGMRGVVSMAAAMAIPLLNSEGESITERNMILFLTFGVIFTTLIIPSLTLPGLVRWLNRNVPPTEEEEELEVRTRTDRKTLEVMDAICEELQIDKERPMVRTMRSYYETRLDRHLQRLEVKHQEPLDPEEIRLLVMRTSTQMREHIRRESQRGKISEEIRQKLRADIDYDEMRLLHFFGG